MNNDIPRQYRVNENGETLDFRPTLLIGAFAGVAMLAISALADLYLDDCGYIRQFLNDECSASEAEQGEVVSVEHPSLVVR